MYRVFMLIMTVEMVPIKFLKLIILFNGIQKKSQKTPKEALDKAEALMKKYFELKNEQKNER